jgi:uncharacterized protein YkwD
MHHKKRNGQHHKVTKTYHKTYWPYLPLVTIIGLGIGVNTFWAHASHGVLGYATDMSATELLTGTNLQRTDNSESALNLDTQLDNAAQAKANSMVALNYWSHDTPSGQPPWVFITAAGYNYVTAGENLAYGFNTSGDVITAWMGSPEHRANILNSAYKDVGFGIANSTDFQSSGPETIIVAEYGAPAVAATTTPPSEPTSISKKPVTTTTPPTDAISSQSSSPTPTAASTIPSPTPVAAATVSPTAKPTTPPSTTDPQATPTSTPVALEATPVSRMQLVSDNAAPLSAFTVTIIALFCVALLLVKHGLLWRKVIRNGERFVVKYHALDVTFVTIGVIGFVITRSAGFIY